MAMSSLTQWTREAVLEQEKRSPRTSEKSSFNFAPVDVGGRSVSDVIRSGAVKRVLGEPYVDFSGPDCTLDVLAAPRDLPLFPGVSFPNSAMLLTIYML